MLLSFILLLISRHPPTAPSPQGEGRSAISVCGKKRYVLLTRYIILSKLLSELHLQMWWIDSQTVASLKKSYSEFLLL